MMQYKGGKQFIIIRRRPCRQPRPGAQVTAGYAFFADHPGAAWAIPARLQRSATTSTERERAEAILASVLRETGARDPREFYRERLRELKERDPRAYSEAVRYYEDTLIPSIAAGGMAPLAAWTEYGRRLAELGTPGRTMAIDDTGKASPYVAPAATDALVLHLPKAAGGRAQLVGLPPELSDAQRATYDWLVQGRLKLRDSE